MKHVIKRNLFPEVEPDTYPIFSNTPPSDAFTDIFCKSGGTPQAICQLCSRVHFDGTGDNMDEGELDELLLKLEAQPDKYVCQDGTLCFDQIDGKQVVLDCPCNGMRLYEEFFWKYRLQFSSYFILVAKKNLEIAANDDLIAEAAKSIVEKT